MGIIWESAMPLLSTLAALVIIVHSAEEDRETEYRRELLPRIVDAGASSYEEPWRVVNMDPLMKPNAQSNTWSNSSPEEPTKRRRPGRKRKRRPQTSLNEGLAPQETNIYPEEPLRPYFDIDLTNVEQAGETQKRRRKKLESRPDPWTEVSQQRPFRRRGHRRKRPSLKTLPEVSEFEVYHTKDQRPNITDSSEQKDMDSSNQNDHSIVLLENKENDNDKTLHHNVVTKEPDRNLDQEESNDEFSLPMEDIDRDKTKNHGPLQEDKSLSEFSYESIPQTDELQQNKETKTYRETLKEKPPRVFNEYEKSQSNNPVDPITLKDILKKSNGTSLSEILQLHNLSLADLLHGSENVISIFKSGRQSEYQQTIPIQIVNNLQISKPDTASSKDLVENGTEEKLLHAKHIKDPLAEYVTTTQMTKETVSEQKEEIDTITVKPENKTHKLIELRRYPVGNHRKLRIKPTINSTNRSPLSREFTPNARKYSHHKRITSKSTELRNVTPALINISKIDSDETENYDITTVMSTSQYTAKDQLIIQTDNNVENLTPSEIEKGKHFAVDKEIETTDLSTTSINPEKSLEYIDIENATPVPATKSVSISPGMRRHSFNKRFKKKRLRQKHLTTEPPQINNFEYSLTKENILSSTEVIINAKKQQTPKDNEESVTVLEDFMTTLSPSNGDTITKSTKLSYTTNASSTSPTTKSTTQRIHEKPAKMEIDEIFKDIYTSARLARILRERNMTLSELIEHRERGSSHIHLADIFHNTSKEPNPPEPFLSKSIIEPISKETYPLRAILDANAHDTTYKPLINESSKLETSYLNIPIVMDFGNNVNEHAENMGIMSLFNSFKKNINMKKNAITLQKDSQQEMHKNDLTLVNTTELPTVRESRVLTDNNNEDDVVSWNEIFSLMRRNYKNETNDILQSIQNGPSLPKPPKPISVDDVDGNGLIILEDLQQLKVFDSNVAPDSSERLEVNPLGQVDSSDAYEKIPSQTKSVTVATASIAGLAMVLFLFTYAVFKWKQQKVVQGTQKSFCDEKIPTPVFENRKGRKNNSSTRSMSPMLSTSNIYTLSTLDSRNGKESPEYMWDTLRKPFQ